MTFTKLAYISTKSFEDIRSSLDECGFEDKYSEHTDSSDEAELWVELDGSVLECLEKYGYISASEHQEIEANEADTILFY